MTPTHERAQRMAKHSTYRRHELSGRRYDCRIPFERTFGPRRLCVCEHCSVSPDSAAVCGTATGPIWDLVCASHSPLNALKSSSAAPPPKAAQHRETGPVVRCSYSYG